MAFLPSRAKCVARAGDDRTGFAPFGQGLVYSGYRIAGNHEFCGADADHLHAVRRSSDVVARRGRAFVTRSAARVRRSGSAWRCQDGTNGSRGAGVATDRTVAVVVCAYTERRWDDLVTAVESAAS